jgi:hypothetical protein
LLTVGGPDAIDDCETFVFFLSSNITSQQNLPAKPTPSSTLYVCLSFILSRIFIGYSRASRTIIGIVIGGTVGVTALLWVLFLLRRHMKRRSSKLKRGIETGTAGSRTMTERDFVLDSEFGMTFSSVIPSSRGTMTSKAYEKSPENQLFRYSRMAVPLPTNDRSSNNAQLKPPPIKVPSYVPMDVVAESRRSEDALVYPGNLSPSLLPEWAQGSSNRNSTATTLKRQTRESGRVV